MESFNKGITKEEVRELKEVQENIECLDHQKILKYFENQGYKIFKREYSINCKLKSHLLYTILENENGHKIYIETNLMDNIIAEDFDKVRFRDFLKEAKEHMFFNNLKVESEEGRDDVTIRLLNSKNFIVIKGLVNYFNKENGTKNYAHIIKNKYEGLLGTQEQERIRSKQVSEIFDALK